MMSQVASWFKYYQKWVFEEKKLSQHSENSQNTSIKINYSTTFKISFLPLEQNKIVAKMRVLLIFKICQYERNDFYIVTLQFSDFLRN